MASFGFLIDNRSCIGCHACSVACKSENEVPLGVYRTWVKTTETGAGADAKRHFQVTRCNHCANPPCVRICPTQAMYQREDGIVEFDNAMCIGCKACMQACPYDSIHIDPDSGTAAKCHYCSHRTDRGLEPACVVVCPTHAIQAGDIDDPTSEIARTLAREKVTVRKPEKGTAPKLFYVEGSDVNLVPTAAERAPRTFAAADVRPIHGGDGIETAEVARASAAAARFHRSGAALRAPQPQGLPAAGPVPGAPRTAAGQMVQVAYNAQHAIPWHWPVPAYLVTKAIGAGVFGLAALAWLLGAPFHAPTAIGVGAVSLLGLLATTALLVYDLEHPERFLFILRYPQLRSWLARGAFVLIGFSTVAGLWWAVEVGEAIGLFAGLAAPLRTPLLALGLPLAGLAAIYTAFLFGQADGRDLWQSPLLPVHLVVQAAMVGGASLLPIAHLASAPPALIEVARLTFMGALLCDLGVILAGEIGMPHSSEAAARAAHEMFKGRYRVHVLFGALAIGHGLALALLLPGNAWLDAAAGAAAIAGLYLYEHAFVMAPQELPNS